MFCRDAQTLMHGHLDAELDPSVSLQYEQHVGECPACGKALAEQQAIQAQMKADSLYFAAPESFRERLRASLAAPKSPSERSRAPLQGQSGAVSRRFPMHWVAAAACLALCVGLGFALARFAFEASGHDPLIQEVASAHIRSLQADHIVDVPSSDRHQVKPWFAGKMDFSPPTPDLENDGFHLVGGRMDYVDGRSVAAIVYRRREHIINMFVWVNSGTDSKETRQETRQGYNLVHWSKDGMTYWLASDLNLTELNELAQLLSSRATSN
jgi:anti-sigma factor RsiW